RGLCPPYDSNNLLPQARDRLQVLLVLAGESQHEMLAAVAHVVVEPVGEARRRPGVAHLALAQDRRRLAVVALEKTVELIVGSGGVVAEQDVEIQAADKRIGVAPGRARDVLDLAPLAAPLRGVGRDRHPAVEIAAGTLDARGERPADPQRRTAGTMRRRA